MEPNEMHETRQVMLAQGKLIKDLQAQITGLTERFEVHKHQEGHTSGWTSVPVFEEHDRERLVQEQHILADGTIAEIKYTVARFPRKQLRAELRQLAAEAQHCCPRGFSERLDQLADRV